MLRLLARARPVLILWLVCLAAMAVSLTWERGTSYDDGGLGTLAFIILYSVGLPFALALQAIAQLVHTENMVVGVGIWAAAFLVGSVPYLGLDRALTRWARRPVARTSPPAPGA